MRLDIQNWKPFFTARLFPVMENGKANQQMLDEGNECFYVGAKKDDNGVMIHCMKNDSLITKGNCIVFICNGQGSVGFANYMDVDFIGTTDIVAGYNEYLNEFIGIFFATIYSQERPKYSFGRKWKTHLRDTEIKLPIQRNADGSPIIDTSCKWSDEGYVPDWQFMEDYIKSLHYKPLTTKNKVGQIPDLKVTEWKEFVLSNYFDIVPGKYHYPKEYEDGETPYYSASNENNGISSYIDLPPDFEGNCIVTGKIGCTAFYASDPFCATSDVNIFKPRFEMTRNMGLFISSVINFNENYKWAYGRQCRVGNSKQIAVKLPADTEGNPDWQFMENYIKSLPYGDRL